MKKITLILILSVFMFQMNAQVSYVAETILGRSDLLQRHAFGQSKNGVVAVFSSKWTTQGYWILCRR